MLVQADDLVRPPVEEAWRVPGRSVGVAIGCSATVRARRDARTYLARAARRQPTCQMARLAWHRERAACAGPARAARRCGATRRSRPAVDQDVRDPVGRSPRIGVRGRVAHPLGVEAHHVGRGARAARARGRTVRGAAPAGWSSCAPSPPAAPASARARTRTGSAQTCPTPADAADRRARCRRCRPCGPGAAGCVARSPRCRRRSARPPPSSSAISRSQ